MDVPTDLTPHAGMLWDMTPPADVPQHFDTLPDGSQTIITGDVSGLAVYNHDQGQNPEGFKEDCGLVSVQDVINQLGGNVSEGDVVQHAIDHGEVSQNPWNSADSGGTSVDQQVNLLRDASVPAHPDTGSSLEDLASHVDQGHPTIIEVNAGVVWHDANHVGNGDWNHAVVVTGVARNPDTGAIQGFYLNDSGNGTSAEFVSASDMTTGWLNTGGNMVVADVTPGDNVQPHFGDTYQPYQSFPPEQTATPWLPTYTGPGWGQ